MPSLELPLALALAPPRPNPAQGTARRFELIWDLRNDNGQSVPSGVYFVQLAAGGSKLSRRMIALP